MGVVEERAVTIYEWIDSFVKNISDSTSIECGSELRAVRVLNAMRWPKDLFDTVKNDAITWLFARMVGRKAAMIGRMPILRRQDELKVSLQFVGDGNDFVTVRHGQRAAG